MGAIFRRPPITLIILRPSSVMSDLNYLLTLMKRWYKMTPPLLISRTNGNLVHYHQNIFRYVMQIFFSVLQIIPNFMN